MFTLVPSNFFNPATAKETLAAVTGLKEGESVNHTLIQEYDAVLIYSYREGSVDCIPPIAEMLKQLPLCKEYNKIICSLSEGFLYIAIAQGKSLLLANYFRAPDFTTAEYYLFSSLKKLQLNPELSTITWMGRLETEDEMSLYRYFKAVEQI
ncbi:MAG: DUF3822 family protein [Bacteroidales bacterium]|nr:DUF3822 family protein [Candidatus Cryptobacteroides equifaecalis]